MINVNDATKSAYSGDSINKTLTITVPNRNITFTNSDLVSQSMELTESIESEGSLTFKGCIASQLKFQVAHIVTDLRGEYIEAKIQAGNTQEIPLFRGYIDEQNNQTHEDVITEFICYDVLYQKGDIECGEWYRGLNFPMSVKRFRDLFFSFIGITQEDDALPNDALQMQKVKSDINPDDTSKAISLNSRYVMQCICQANARYGMIGRNGKFKYVKIEDTSSDFGTYPSETTYPSATTYPARPIRTQIISTSMYKNVDYEPYATAKITKVVVHDEADIVKGEYGASDINVFIIAGNIVAYSVDMKACATNIYNEVKDLSCVSTRINLVGLPFVECGDQFRYATRLNVINSIVLSRTLSGIQSLNDNYTSNLDQYQSGEDTLSNQIIRLEGKSNVLTRTVDETKSELTQYETDNNENIRVFKSDVTQTAKDIRAEVIATETVWDTTGFNIAHIFYNKDASEYPKNMVADVYYLNQQTGTIWIYSGGRYRRVKDCSRMSRSLSSSIVQQASEISAKVSQTGGDNRSFGWSLTSDAFTLSSNNKTVFKCNSNGIEINGSGKFSGEITATSGKIGGWDISSSMIYHSGSGGNLIIKSDGNIYSTVGGDKKWELRQDGTFISKKGEIGGWKIESDQLKGGEGLGWVTMTKKGDIYCELEDPNTHEKTTMWALYHHGGLELKGYATVSRIEAAEGRIGELETNSLTADNINSKTFTLDSGHIGNLDASKITSGVLSANHIDVNTLASTSFSGLTLNVNRVYAAHGVTIGSNPHMGEQGYDLTVWAPSIFFNGNSLSLIEITTVSGRYKVLGLKVS